MNIMNITKVEKRVDVIASYRSKGDVSGICFPHKIRWEGKETKFKELGLRHPTSKGQRMIHVFDMSDGTNDYRLEFDAERLIWNLVEVCHLS
jgi:hypothetical protein